VQLWSATMRKPAVTTQRAAVAHGGAA